MGLTNRGKIDAHDNAGDGIHLAKGANLDNFGDINTYKNGRHGIFIAEDVETLRANVAEASALLDKEDLQSLREELKPLYAMLNKELAAPEVSVSSVKPIFLKIVGLLPGVGQGIAGNYVYENFHTLVDAAHKLLA